jgi:hypothetical protein
MVILVAFFLSFGYLIISPYTHPIPSCTDGVQNGTELGIDCGGSCPTACAFQVEQISILWSRVFQVIPGRYNAVAYLENHNQNAVIEKIKYRFRFADKNNIYIGKREGETFIPPAGKFAVFEPGIGLGNAVPVYTTFEFTETPVWINVSQDKINQLKVTVSNIQLENQDTSPHLSATIKNNSLFTIPAVNVIALMYDENGNAVSASRTYIDVLKKEESQDVDFTWPEPITANIVTKEIIPIYDIFSVKLE